LNVNTTDTIDSMADSFLYMSKVLFEDTEMNFPTVNGTLNKVFMRNVSSIVLGESKINSFVIEYCMENTDIYLDEIIFKSVSIRNCLTDKLVLVKLVVIKYQ